MSKKVTLTLKYEPAIKDISKIKPKDIELNLQKISLKGVASFEFCMELVELVNKYAKREIK